MVVGVGIIEVYIHESRSLKEKRGVMKSLIRRTQNEFNISIAEVDGHDNWKQGIIGFAVVGNDRSFVNSKMEMILNFVDNLHWPRSSTSAGRSRTTPTWRAVTTGGRCPMDFKRADRVADLIKQELSSILRREVGDPRIANITVTDVKLTDDLRSARIYFVELGKDRLSADVEKGLSKAKGFLKRELGKRLQLRYVPELAFFYDPSFEYGSRIEKLLKEVRKDETDDPTDR
jgi:ribosome-binding factor A